MSDDAAIGVGVIGLGFIGRLHIAAYEAARRDGHPCRLTAVCDQDPQRRSGRVETPGNIAASEAGERLFDPAQVRAYADAHELLADRGVQLVSICTPTDTHVELAIRALAAGKHVLVEKPVALRSADVQRLADAAAAADTLCMPAMCMRFWPGWPWLKEQIGQRTYGAVRSAAFRRLGSPPGWSREFYSDLSRCGGALLDLHIHDTDFVRWCFGDPQEVESVGSVNHVTTTYRYAGGPPHVLAEGGWLPGVKFSMRYRVEFEHAVAEYDSSRDPPLILTQRGPQPIELPARTGYDLEIRHLLEAIRSGGRELRATIADAVATARLLEAEQRSLDTGAPVSAVT